MKSIYFVILRRNRALVCSYDAKLNACKIRSTRAQYVIGRGQYRVNSEDIAGILAGAGLVHHAGLFTPLTLVVPLHPKLFLPWPLPERQAMVMWPPIQDVIHAHLTEQTRTDMSAKVCN